MKIGQWNINQYTVLVYKGGMNYCYRTGSLSKRTLDSFFSQNQLIGAWKIKKLK